MTEKPKQNATLEVSEKLSDRDNISIISNGFQNIIREYSGKQKLNQKEARSLAMKQLQELRDSFDRYKNTPNGQRLVAESKEGAIGASFQVLSLLQTEENLQNARIILE